MEVIKNLIIDSFNGMSLRDLPLFFLQLLVAGFLGYVFQFIVNKKLKKEVVSNAVIIAVGLALIASITKYSLPFVVLALPVIMWLKPKEGEGKFAKIGLLIVGIIGIGCGVGSVVQTILGVMVLSGIILLTPLKANE